MQDLDNVAQVGDFVILQVSKRKWCVPNITIWHLLHDTI